MIYQCDRCGWCVRAERLPEGWRVIEMDDELHCDVCNTPAVTRRMLSGMAVVSNAARVLLLDQGVGDGQHGEGPAPAAPPRGAGEGSEAARAPGCGSGRAA